MRRLDPIAWARDTSPLELAALLAAIAVFGYVGWDGALWDARFQLVLHLVGVGAIMAVGVIALRGHPMPRTPIDLPLLGLVAAFALATVGALNVGMSLRALGSVAAFAMMLPVALLAVRHRASWVGLVSGVPVLLLSIVSLVSLLARRIEWIAVGAPGLPPLRLAGEGTPFGSVAVPPFVIIPAWALAGLIEPRWARRAVRIGLVAVGVPLVILSGSRSAWLAIAAGITVGFLPWALARRRQLRLPQRLTPRGFVLGAAAAAAGGLVLLLVLPRLTAVSSLLYRGALWRDTLAAWSIDPLLGIGPGFMPYARQAAAADFTYPVRQPHSHNLALGVLGDAGLVGLAAALVLVGTLLFVAGPWRSRTATGRTAAIVLVGLAFGGLFEDLTFLPNFNLLAVLLVAVALIDAGRVSWAPIPPPATLRRHILVIGAGGMAVVLAGVMAITDAAAIAYRIGIDRAYHGDWQAASGWLARAVEVDPWHPAGPRALTVAADAAGQPVRAIDAARHATRLNPGDATAWTNLALLCAAAQDRACTLAATERAGATARYLAPELVNAALLADGLGAADEADALYRRSLLTHPGTSFVVEWPRPIAVGDGTLPGINDLSSQLNLLLARLAAGERIEPETFEHPAVRALAHASVGERDEAEAMLARAIDESPGEIRTHDINVILRDAWGLPTDHARRVASAARGRAFPSRDGGAGLPRTTFDIGSFRGYPRDGLVTSAVRLGTRPPFPWPLRQILP